MAIVNVAANDEADLRAKCAAASDGDTVNVPAGTYNLTATVAIANKGIRLAGEGKLTRIVVTNLAINAITITNNAAPANDLNGLQITDLAIPGNGGVLNLAGIGMVGSAGKALTDLAIRRVTVSGMQDGINIDQTASVGLGEHCSIDECQITTNNRYGIALTYLAQARISLTDVNSSGSGGIRVISCGNISIRDCSPQGNNTLNGTNPRADAQMFIKLSHGFMVDNAFVESMPTAAGATKAGIVISNCVGGNIRGVEVAQQAFQSDSIGLHLMDPSCKGISMDLLRHSFITTPILTDSGCEGPFIRNAGVIRAAP